VIARIGAALDVPVSADIEAGPDDLGACAISMRTR